MREDFAGLRELLLVAEKRSFTAAAAELRVTPSAVSQAIGALEERLHARLVQRTTRSVSLTEAGARFVAELRPAMEGIRGAFATLESARGRPTGTLRLNVPRLAFGPVIKPMLARFLTAHPELRIDVTLDDGLRDIVAEGYDAGIRLGERVDRDMVAVPVTGDMRMAVVGSPAYFDAHPHPRHPRDLAAHDCVNYRHATSRNIARWEFEVDGRELTVAVNGRVITNDNEVMVLAALDGQGLAYVMEHTVTEHLAAKRLVRVLTRYCPSFPGLYLYYPNRKNLALKLRALIDFLRARP
ncbi:LysR family transcriptional regulator [Corallococcus macrosporus]|uniref:Transcriptional regulator n=1 Tax=Corallococcus macrosporus DSM 14697 TaxID=1189310 RepID=A0A250JNW4_9BACT|nr:LysR family transcriptional regulator [Corallococcus macrosporus]ATB45574.1 transcriptional regulator [Corallococcus macrosporus DSM 14697]